jgi:hypothetical protein
MADSSWLQYWRVSVVPKRSSFHQLTSLGRYQSRPKMDEIISMKKPSPDIGISSIQLEHVLRLSLSKLGMKWMRAVTLMSRCLSPGNRHHCKRGWEIHTAGPDVVARRKISPCQKRKPCFQPLRIHRETVLISDGTCWQGENWLKVSEYRTLTRIFWPKKEIA